MGRLITAAPALISGAAALAIAIGAAVRSLRNASQRIDDIFGEENPQP
ncbi:hypothetical protein [Streptomyces europaeiscabiei]|nr:hypothetical protein [Streptomyces europaeiscabiei]MDX3839800.1 hypothetical protein [Streptomyces europaeiscabiei]